MKKYSKEQSLFFYLSRALADRFAAKSAIEIGNNYDNKGYLINMFKILLEEYYKDFSSGEKDAFKENYQINNIYCDDCINFMDNLCDDFVDLTVTSPSALRAVAVKYANVAPNKAISKVAIPIIKLKIAHLF